MILARIVCAVGSSDSLLAAVYKSYSGRNVLRLKVQWIKCFAVEEFGLEDMEPFLPSEIARLVYGNKQWIFC
jgi:hypothetical protein